MKVFRMLLWFVLAVCMSTGTVGAGEIGPS